jgi:hypothetical protein
LNKQNLLVFLTPHVVHTRNDLQSLALDERQKFVRSLGRREVNNMPASQFQQLYQPTFNNAVSPQQDLTQSQGQSWPENGLGPAMPPTSSTGIGITPGNIDEVGPSSRNNAGSSRSGPKAATVNPPGSP